jgi:hypothetical protein
LSTVFQAAGPDIGQGVIPLISNIGIAPTLEHLLGARPVAAVGGHAFNIQ